MFWKHEDMFLGCTKEYMNLVQKPPDKKPPGESHPDKSPPTISPQYESPEKKKPGAGFFLGLVDPNRNRLASTAYFVLISSIILGSLSSGDFGPGGFFPGGFLSGTFDWLPYTDVPTAHPWCSQPRSLYEWRELTRLTRINNNAAV